jgi:hypothetical protein
MSDDRFPIACRIYRMLLRCYPRAHRTEYGELMEQLFRDQCRDARRKQGTFGLVAMWFQLPGDFIFTVLREHISNLPNIMKNLNIKQLSAILFAIGVGLAFFSSPTLVGTHVSTVFIYLSTLAILLRAIAEWFRPPGDSLRAILWGLGLSVAFGLILPFWAKLHANYGVPTGFNPAVHAIPVLLNLIVPIVKALIAVTKRTT